VGDALSSCGWRLTHCTQLLQTCLVGSLLFGACLFSIGGGRGSGAAGLRGCATVALQGRGDSVLLFEVLGVMHPVQGPP
jgi:hypothetical protein